MSNKIMAYRRPNGKIGIRNDVAIISAMDNSNPSANRIASLVKGTIPITTPFGRGQIGHDLKSTQDALAGLGNHPNVAAVLLLSLSLETAEPIRKSLEASGKPVVTMGLQETGGTLDLTIAGAKAAAKMVLDASELMREPCDMSELVIGVECGGSDATSGLASNPATGKFSDKLIAAGGTIILSEPAEFMGAEHLLAARAVRKEDGDRIVEMVKYFEDIAIDNGVDMRGTNPTLDNIAGGLTTLEEKSLGAIAKGGTTPIQGIVEYGVHPENYQGLVVMNTPSAACESMTGLAAGGCHIIIFSTGAGNSIGATPICPTIKITGNPRTMNNMGENIDVNVSTIITENETIESAGERLWSHVEKIANGKKTCAEVLGEDQLSVSRWGLSV